MQCYREIGMHFDNYMSHMDMMEMNICSYSAQSCRKFGDLMEEYLQHI